MGITDEQFKAAARKAYEAGDVKTARSLLARVSKAPSQQKAPAMGSTPQPSPMPQQGTPASRAAENLRLSGMDMPPVVNPVYDPIRAIAGDGLPHGPAMAGAQDPELLASIHQNDLNSRQTPMSAKMQGIAAGGSFNFNDELGASLIAPFSEDTYAQVRDTLRGAEGAAAAEHPGAYYTGMGIGGLMVPGVAGVKALSKAPSLLNTVVRGAAIGAGQGALSGIGSGEDTSGRISGGLTGGAIGAVLGGAIPALGALGKQAVRAASDSMRGTRLGDAIGSEIGTGSKTARVLADLIGREDPRAMREALAKSGQGAMLGDASRSATGALDMAMQTPVPGAQIASRRINDRAKGAYGDIARVLDETMGAPVGLNTAQSDIRSSTAENRGWLYDQAFGQDIDWRSPAGTELRGLLQSTPKDVMALAAKNASMKARAPYVPDSAYADEFADTVTSKPGPLSGNNAERQELNAFFSEYDRVSGGSRFKRPTSHTIKALGGVDPSSSAGQELYALGINPRTAPGLFRRGGMGDLDNLDISKFPDTMSGDGTGNYADRNAVIEAIVSEAKGQPLLASEDIIDSATFSELDQLFPQYEARRAALSREDRAMARGPTAPAQAVDTVPMQSIRDVDQIKRTLDEVQRTNAGQGMMGGQTEYGVEAGKRAREIRDLLMEISPAYKDALAAGADTISRVKGVEFGSTILRKETTRETVADMVKNSTPGEMTAIRQGLRSQIDETLANVRAVASDQNVDARAASAAWSNMSSPAARSKMQMLLGDAWPKLEKQLDEAGAAIGLRANTSANSATAGRQFAKEAVDAVNAPGALRRGEVIKAGRNLIGGVMGGSPEAIARASADTRSELADILTRQGGTVPQNLNTILKALMDNPQNLNAGKTLEQIVRMAGMGAIPAAVRGANNMKGQ